MRLRSALGTAVAGALALGALAAPAQAAYFPGQPVDGPSADILGLGGIAMSRGGDGHVAYLKRDAAIDHVFVAFVSAGAPRQPRRVDTGQLTPSSQARVGAADDGRAVAVWVNAGSLWSSVRASSATDWSAPAAIFTATGAPAANPSLSMGPSGAAYVAFEVGGDVRAARLSGTTWTLLADPLDIDPARTAADVEIATSADGTALAAWAEAGKVFVRRVVRTRLSTSPQEVSVTSLDGSASVGAADSPSVDIEDDSSYAWVAARQDFDSGSRVYARQLVGSELTPPVAIDGGTSGADDPHLDMTGRGRGLASIGVRGSQATIGASLGSDNRWRASQGLGSGVTMPPRAVAALSENGRGTIAWQQPDGSGQASVVARYFDARRFDPVTQLSDPAFGAVDAGVQAAADAGGNQLVAYAQGTGADRRVLVAVFDKEPRTTGGSNFDKWQRSGSFRLKWSKVDDPWGGVQYRVDVDGIPLTTTARTAFNVRDLPDGAHVWNVVAIDSRGQATDGPDRALYVDKTPPTVELTARTAKAGRPAPIRLSATDGDAIAGSGVASVRIRYGDGRVAQLAVPRIGIVEDAPIGYRYRKKGRYTLRVEVRDVAGNLRVAKTRVVVRK
jgi:hypothetical protein